jgi:hypothetical protein
MGLVFRKRGHRKSLCVIRSRAVECCCLGRWTLRKLAMNLLPNSKYVTPMRYFFMNLLSAMAIFCFLQHVFIGDMYKFVNRFSVCLFPICELLPRYIKFSDQIIVDFYKMLSCNCML